MALFFGYPKIFLWTAEKRDRASTDVHVDRGRKRRQDAGMSDDCSDRSRTDERNSAIMYEMNAFP